MSMLDVKVSWEEERQKLIRGDDEDSEFKVDLKVDTTYDIVD